MNLSTQLNYDKDLIPASILQGFVFSQTSFLPFLGYYLACNVTCGGRTKSSSSSLYSGRPSIFLLLESCIITDKKICYKVYLYIQYPQVIKYWTCNNL